MYVAKGLKLKVRKFWGLTPTFAEVTGEKLVVKGVFALLLNEFPLPSISLLNKIKEGNIDALKAAKVCLKIFHRTSNHKEKTF